MSRPAVFLDRDGTIIVEKVYLSDPDGVEFIAGSVEAMRQLADAGFVVVIVTNQAGIARGKYGVEEYQAVARRVAERLEEGGVQVGGTYFCPHHPDVTGACDCRKPGTGMYREAAAALALDFDQSWFVGDKLSDVGAAEVLGGCGILVRTGYGAEVEGEAPSHVPVVDDLATAVRHIIDRASR